MVDVQFYDKARLNSQHEIRPGQIVEALPGSFITSKEWGQEPRNDNPSEIFGYVIGEVHFPVLHSIPKLEARINVRNIIAPSIHGNIVNLTRYRAANRPPVYLVVGEIGFKETGPFNIYRAGSLFLNRDDEREVREQVLDFATKRDQKEYTFRTPQGQILTLNELLLSLKAK